MSEKQIKITYNNGRVSIYENGTLEFGSFMHLFDCLLDNPPIDLDNIPDQFNTLILGNVHKFDIKEIDFSYHRRYEFILRDVNEKNQGYDVKFSEFEDPDKTVAIKETAEMLDFFEKSGLFKSSGGIKGEIGAVKVFEGNMDDLLKMGKNLPEPIRKVIDEIKGKHPHLQAVSTPEKKTTH